MLSFSFDGHVHGGKLLISSLLAVHGVLSLVVGLHRVFRLLIWFVMENRSWFALTRLLNPSAVLLIKPLSRILPTLSVTLLKRISSCRGLCEVRVGCLRLLLV